MSNLSQDLWLSHVSIISQRYIHKIPSLSLSDMLIRFCSINSNHETSTDQMSGLYLLFATKRMYVEINRQTWGWNMTGYCSRISQHKFVIWLENIRQSIRKKRDQMYLEQKYAKTIKWKQRYILYESPSFKLALLARLLRVSYALNEK